MLHERFGIQTIMNNSLHSPRQYGVNVVFQFIFVFFLYIQLVY